MVVYTFQNPNILAQIIKEQKIRCDSTYWNEDMRKYYEWMYKQYKQRIGSQEKSLIWCWEQMPDFYFEPDEDDEWTEKDELYRYRLLLMLDIPLERILWSDYDTWHIPLNNGQILNEAEQQEEEKGKRFDETHGWEYVFDFQWLIENGWSGEIIKQGVFDIADISTIKEIKYYDAKYKKFIAENLFKLKNKY